MPELVTRLAMDDANFKSGIASAVGSLNKLDKTAVLTKRGLNDFFKSADSQQMINSIAGVEGVLKKLEKTMSSSGATVKQQLKSMTQAAVDLENTWRNLSAAEKASAEGQALRQHIDELIQKSGELKDTMGDVQGAIKFMSSDTAGLDALAQGITTLSATMQVGAGIASAFGVSEEKVAQVQKSLVAIMAVTNGLQTIQNALQKDSALMTFIRTAREKGLAVALGLRTAATVAATGAEAAETTAVEANTAAWLMNPVGAVLVAVLALTAGIIALTKALLSDTDAEEGEAEAIKSVKSAAEEGFKTYKKNEMELTQLKKRVDSFVGSKKEEDQLVKELNQKYGEALGKYKDLDSWKKALASTSLYYCRVMQSEAKLAALNAEAYGAWAKAMAGEDYEKNMAKYNALQKPIADALDDLMFYQDQLKIARKLAGDISGQESNKSGSGSGKTKTKKTSSADNKTEREQISAAISDLQKKLDTLDKQKYPEKVAEIVRKIESKYREIFKFLDTSTEEGADEQIKTLKKIRSYYAVSSDDYKRLTAEIMKAQENLYVAKGGTIGDFGWDKQDLRNKIKELEEEIEHSTQPQVKANLTIAKEDLEKELKKLEAMGSDLPEVKIKAPHTRPKTFDYRLSELEKLQEDLKVAERNYDELYKAFQNKEISFEQFEEGGKSVDALRDKIKQLTISNDLKEYKKQMYDLSETLAKNTISGLRSMYDAFKTLSDPMKNAENEFEGFLNVLDSLVTMYDTVKGIIDIVKEITSVIKMMTGAQEAMNAVTETGNMLKQQETTMSIENASAKHGETMASQSQALASGQEAASKAMAENSGTGPWGWIIGIAAAVAVLAMLATILSKGFAGGGIIPGNSHHGDQIYARVNSGEMILNKKQQANLFRLLDSGQSLGNSGGQVQFKISGQELVGVLNNYENKHSKIR